MIFRKRLYSSFFDPKIAKIRLLKSKNLQKSEKFFENNILNENSNVVFGEGGAGTFSDGKLNTLVKDKRGLIKEVLKVFVSCGANEQILYDKNPHIGTDILRKVIVNLRNKIIEMGGVFYYNSHLDDLIIENNTFKGAIINNKKYL